MVEHLVLNKANNFYIFFYIFVQRKYIIKKIKNKIVDVPKGK